MNYKIILVKEYPPSKRTSIKSKVLKVLFFAAEAVPLVKSGGLADSVGNLCKALAKKGIKIEVVLPKHGIINQRLYQYKDRGALNEEAITAYHIQKFLNDNIFWRQSLFADPEQHNEVFVSRAKIFNEPSTENLDFILLSTKNYRYFGQTDPLYFGAKDNIRFNIYNWLAAAYLKVIDKIYKEPTTITHFNDWQTGFIHFYNNELTEGNSPPSLFTIHNMSYVYRLNMKYFNECSGSMGDKYPYIFDPLHPRGMHIKDQMCPLAAGMKSANLISTVSGNHLYELITDPTISKDYYEIINFLNRENRLRAIHNGYGEDFEISKFNNNQDPQNVNDLMEIKNIIKLDVQKELGLKIDENSMLIAYINRWADQKSYKETIEVMRMILQKNPHKNIQFVSMASPHDFEIDKKIGKKIGQSKAGAEFLKLQEEFPQLISIDITYNERLSYMLYAASDLMLLPSKNEPGGITDKIGFANGTLTLVNDVGGLHDSIAPTYGDPEHQIGFVFKGKDKGESYFNKTFNKTKFITRFYKELKNAIDIFFNHKNIWNKFVWNAYNERYKYQWDPIAELYIALYEELLSNQSNNIKHY
ncbi:glycogen/starch synthase [Candidatus Margulisiibacteriota bacterium]